MSGNTQMRGMLQNQDVGCLCEVWIKEADIGVQGLRFRDTYVLWGALNPKP